MASFLFLPNLTIFLILLAKLMHQSSTITHFLLFGHSFQLPLILRDRKKGTAFQLLKDIKRVSIFEVSDAEKTKLTNTSLSQISSSSRNLNKEKIFIQSLFDPKSGNTIVLSSYKILWWLRHQKIFNFIHFRKPKKQTKNTQLQNKKPILVVA